MSDHSSLSPLNQRASATNGRSNKTPTDRQSFGIGNSNKYRVENINVMRPIVQPISTSLPEYAIFIFALPS